MAEGGGSESEDKTEAPTQKRIDQAREEGQVPLSKEAVTLAVLAAGTLALSHAMPPASEGVMQAARSLLAASGDVAAGASVMMMVRAALYAVLPVAGAVAAIAVAATLLQTGFLVSTKHLHLNFGRLNPVTNAKRLVGMDTLIELLRTLLKLAVVGTAVWHAFGDPSQLMRTLTMPVGSLLEEARVGFQRLAEAALGAFAVVAVFDVLLIRIKHYRRMRMSRQELKDEAKESEGDPYIKGRLKQIRMQRARRRMAQTIPKASVVITNPTHFAVALAYDRGKGGAPKVVAKGADAMAARIRELAKEHRVPIVPNPPLARALFKVAEDAEIPSDLYQAVAEIIAFVMGLRKTAPPVRDLPGGGR